MTSSGDNWETPPELVEARRALLDALDALEPYIDSLVLIGAQAIYLHTGAGTLETPPTTTDADSEQTLVDDQGREHSTSSAGMFLEDNDLWLQEINPGNTAEGVIVFDIPADATPVALELHDSMFSGGVTIALP